MFDKMFDLSNEYFLGAVVMFVINMISLYILIRVIYFRYSHKEMFVFAYFLMGIIVFFVGSILNSVNLTMGTAVGLVAVLTILRLRTRQITIKDMSYIFAVFGISVINALRLVAFPLLGRIILNIVILLSAYILEQFLIKNRCESYTITYKNMELLRPDKKQELVQDVANLTGKMVLRVKILKVNYKKNSASLEVYYRE
jgi:hypothetical protein